MKIKLFYPYERAIKSLATLLSCFLLSSALAKANTTTNVWAWGDNSSGQCNVPAGVTNAIAVAAGTGFSMALMPDGRVVTWGVPQDFGFTVTNAVQIAAAGNGAYVLLADGSYHLSKSGIGFRPKQLGGFYWMHGFDFYTNIINVATMQSYLTFPTVATISNIVAISSVGASDDCSYVILKQNDGTYTYAGSLHSDNVPGGAIDQNQPFPSDLTQYVLGTSPDYMYIWQTTNGSVNVYHQLSYGMFSQLPGDLTNVIKIAANTIEPIALKADGTLESWGGRPYLTHGGAVGTLHTNYFPGISNIVYLDGNTFNSTYLALRSDGVVLDPFTGTAVNPLLPFATAVAAGSTHALAIVQPSGPVSPPAILGNPVPQTVQVGANIFFKFSAIGMGNITYQWYFNQTNAIPGATNRFLALNNAQPEQTGSYTLVASNSAGSTTSVPAVVSVAPVLGVNLVPAITMYGGIGTTYRLEYINVVGPTNGWTPLTNITITTSPQIYFDMSALGQPARFWRLTQVQ